MKDTSGKDIDLREHMVGENMYQTLLGITF